MALSNLNICNYTNSLACLRKCEVRLDFKCDEAFLSTLNFSQAKGSLPDELIIRHKLEINDETEFCLMDAKNMFFDFRNLLEKSDDYLIKP